MILAKSAENLPLREIRCGMFFANKMYMKKWVKWIVRIVLGLFLLLILLIIVIHTAPVKKLIRNKLQAYLSSKIKTEVRIASVNYLLPKWVEVDGVFMRDQVGDTLLYGNKLRLDINMFKLLKGEYEINKIAFGDMIMNISRKEKDSVFNYQFLADAFVSKDTTHPDKKSPLRLSVNQIDITNSSFRYNDRFGGTLMSTTVGSFHITMDSINLSTLQFGINKWDVADMVFDMRLVNMHVPKKIDSVITSENSIPRINLTKLTILRSHFAFNGEALGIRTSNDISEMSLQGLVTRAPMKVTLDKLDLKGSSL
jgi:translocation and assembly module TamB